MCFSFFSDLHHLFYECSPTKQLIFYWILFKTIKKPMIFPEHNLFYNFTNTTKMPHIFITKLASLIRLSIFQLRKNNYLSPTPILPFLLKEETYKIKTKFKYFLDKFFLNTFWINFSSILHNKSQYILLINLFHSTIYSLVLLMLYRNMCIFILSPSKNVSRLPININYKVLFTLC